MTITDEGRRRVASMEFAVSIITGTKHLLRHADIAEEVLIGVVVAGLCGFEWGGSNTPTPSELKNFLSVPEHQTEIRDAMKVVIANSRHLRTSRRA